MRRVVCPLFIMFRGRNSSLPGSVAAFELFLRLFINAVALALPLSMLQVCDRILPNQNAGVALDLLVLGVLSRLCPRGDVAHLTRAIAGLVSAI